MNTGEVLAGEPGGGQALVVGDAVNVAARLEQSAEPGEILIGEDTYRLVHDAVTAEQVEPLELRGKTEPVPAWRLVEVVAGRAGMESPARLPARRPRARARRCSSGAFQRAAEPSACELVTRHGSAGVGKSRLTGELLSRLGARDGPAAAAACPTARGSRSGRSRPC